MKNFRFLIVLAGVIAMSIAACKKEASELSDQLEPEQSQNFEVPGMGLDFLPTDEYNRLPTLDATQMVSLMPTDGTTDRAGYVKLALPPVGNQGGEGSCTAWATAYANISYYTRVFNKDFSYTSSQAIRSPEFLYNPTKVNSNCNSGAYMSTVLNYVKGTGVCSWSQMPYSDAGCSTLPNATQKAQAAAAKIESWSSVPRNITTVKQWLDKGYPLLVAFDVNTNFLNQTYNAPYINKTYSNTGNRGGHAVAIIGYDDSKQYLIAQNSWGTGVQDKGYFYISYANFPAMAKELYVAVPFFPKITVRHASAVGDITLKLNNKSYVIKKGQTLTLDVFQNTNSLFMWECVWLNNAWACRWDGDYKPVAGRKYKIIDRSQQYDMQIVQE
jgi:C1A family cysteine protease